MAYSIPAVQAIPEADSQVSFQVDGVERLRYHFAERYPRPFFYPIIGPAGKCLTRMGHPAAPDHDHHRSVWFAHNDLAGNNFWAEDQEPQIRQHRWIHYQDGDDAAAMAVELGWYDSHNALLMTQELIAALKPLAGGEMLLDFQSSFRTKIDPLVFQKSNFGLLAVRVAKSVCKHYGGGRLLSSNRVEGEPDLFGNQADWMDYSGPVDGQRSNGITYLPHPTNPDSPSSWHVRDDGWMCASFNLRSEYKLKPGEPLTLRYRLFVHDDQWSPESADRRLEEYAEEPAYRIERAQSPWRVKLVQ